MLARHELFSHALLLKIDHLADLAASHHSVTQQPEQPGIRWHPNKRKILWLFKAHPKPSSVACGAMYLDSISSKPTVNLLHTNNPMVSHPGGPQPYRISRRNKVKLYSHSCCHQLIVGEHTIVCLERTSTHHLSKKMVIQFLWKWW